MNPITGLALGRIAIGAAALASPERTARLFRLDGDSNRQLPYMTRMFGSREIALGALTLLAPRGARKRVVALGMAVDSADAWAGYAAWRGGTVTRSDGIFLTAPAVGAVLAGAVGLFEEAAASDTPA